MIAFGAGVKSVRAVLLFGVAGSAAVRIQTFQKFMGHTDLRHAVVHWSEEFLLFLKISVENFDPVR